MTRSAQARETRCSVAVFRAEALLLVRSQENGLPVWKLPGGHLRADEGLVACARRELREETGLSVGELHCAFVLDLHDRESGRYLVEIVLIPSGPVAGEPVAREEGRWPQFVAMADLSGLRLQPPHTAHLHALRALHLRDVYDDGTGAGGPPPIGLRTER